MPSHNRRVASLCICMRTDRQICLLLTTVAATVDISSASECILSIDGYMMGAPGRMLGGMGRKLGAMTSMSRLAHSVVLGLSTVLPI